VSARKELIAFLVVAVAAVGSIILFAVSSEHREDRPLSGTTLQVPAKGGRCPSEVRVKRRADGPLQVCPAECVLGTAADGQCTCTVRVKECREAEPQPR
jgi:hypothetical protein